ncbi:HAD family hydrolase [Spirochaeta isovalerica]|uniref:phosphoglycolate phosphatase n=1 Tax=Spirochaeta isovalerica TaxID=150 RepID=A0A841RE02_9SPIO|nr:HAD family phosphatase [Spirochaeta isovalerica]MBB6481447.1 phosphoglycolate phosphatase/pyrophosphatase PpaX [Spirochaeta isovalerica]
MKYRCLIIDHDDTTVDSTPSIHYLAHQEQMKRIGRESETSTLEEWFRVNFDPGFSVYIDSVLKLSEDEKKICYDIWREFTTVLTPPFFEGMLGLLRDFREKGGIIAVVSHSEPDIIRSHYENQEEIPGFLPDRIIGWTGEPEKQKPYPWPVEDIMREFNLSRDEILVVDDLKPGITMALKAGVDSAGVGWSHNLPVIREAISKDSTYYLNSIEELRDLVFS